MASTGPNYPLSVVDAGDGDGWTNPSNAMTNDGAVADGLRSDTFTDRTGILKCTSFGFSLFSDSTILGITTEVYVSYTGSVEQPDIVQLYKAGSLTGSNLTDSVPITTTATIYTFGGAYNLWGTTWTPSEINNSGFGVGISYQGSSSIDGHVLVDFVRVTITYTGVASSSGISSVSGIASITL